MNRRFAMLFCCCGGWLAAADLPVTQVVLYKHGIGFFERAGHLAPGESARLEFNATDMNDVLKSLVIEERGGGKVAALRYDSMDPLSHALAQFPFQIGDSQALAAMLDQLKGARVELKLGDRPVSGVIVNGRVVEGGDKQPEREQITLLMDDGELRTFDLGAVNGIRFDDTRLQQQFKDYLATLAAARSKDKRSVYIDSSDSQAHDVVASYTVPQPVWKSSYRMIFAAAGQPTLEGWAMVDNTTGEDWTKVALSLVSGRPISFVSNLYAPKYIERPTAELPDDAAARPVTYAGSYGVSTGSGGGGSIAGRRAGAPPPPPAAAPRRVGALQTEAMAAPPAEVKAIAPSSIVEEAGAGELGELFEYRIAQPVTIRKNESAMLPFLQQKIDARKLLIYTAGQTSEHPTNAAELTNSTAKTLDGGPITVYDGGAYGGEALMETLKAADKRLIAYAVDLGTRVTTHFDSTSAVIRELHASRGVLTTKSAIEEKLTYTARNLDPKAKTLIIEHPLRQGFTLLNQKPAEKTASHYRFEVALGANATQAFTVSEEHILDNTYYLTSLTPDAILVYVRNRELSDAGRRQLQQIADQKRLIAENDAALAAAGTDISSLTSDEARIRQNIDSLNRVSGQQQQVQNYARQLDDHEQKLAALRDKQADLQKRKTALAADLDKMLEALSF